MSLKIRKNYERIFNNVQPITEPVVDLVEEITFEVQDDGEIREERHMVPRDPSVTAVHNVQTIQQPPKDNKFIGLAMRKKSKVSFM